MSVARRVDITIRVQAPRCCGEELDATHIVSAAVDYTEGKTRAVFSCPRCGQTTVVGDARDDEDPIPAARVVPCSIAGITMVQGDYNAKGGVQ